MYIYIHLYVYTYIEREHTQTAMLEQALGVVEAQHAKTLHELEHLKSVNAQQDARAAKEITESPTNLHAHTQLSRNSRENPKTVEERAGESALDKVEWVDFHELQVRTLSLSLRACVCVLMCLSVKDSFMKCL